jgi:hypothetical protein
LEELAEKGLNDFAASNSVDRDEVLKNRTLYGDFISGIKSVPLLNSLEVDEIIAYIDNKKQSRNP